MNDRYLYRTKQTDTMRKRTKILLNILKFILAVLLFTAALAFIVAWSAIG